MKTNCVVCGDDEYRQQRCCACFWFRRRNGRDKTLQELNLSSFRSRRTEKKLSARYENYVANFSQVV